ncbi:hypothetical protein KBD45_05035 [Candidatus Dojkabacteria bacterium]|nr:hypothetical protein [Candidatus Dojkabacteria bacterium]
MNTETKPLKQKIIIIITIFALLLLTIGIGSIIILSRVGDQTQQPQNKPSVDPSSTLTPKPKPKPTIKPVRKGTGGLSIIPNSIYLKAIGDKTTLKVVYSGEDTTAAAVSLNLGTGLKINKFTPSEGLVVLYDSINTNEIHIGNLTDQIRSGETLFSFEVEAITCVQIGQITIDTEKTEIAGININTFGSINYEVNCNKPSNINSEYNKQITFCDFTRPEIEDPSKKCFLTANIKDNWDLVYDGAGSSIWGIVRDNKNIEHLSFYWGYDEEDYGEIDTSIYTLTKYTLNDGTKIYEEQYKDIDGNITNSNGYRIYTFGETIKSKPSLGFWSYRYTIDSPEIQEVLKSVKILRTDVDYN